MTILVGNGSSVLDAEHGHRIDEFSEVVRFNDCKITGFERHVGTRTDTWYTVLKHDPKRVAALAPKRIVAHSWQPHALRCAIYLSYEPAADRVTKLDHADLKELTRFAGVSYGAWSTGAIAIWQALKREPSVSITGFDWWERERHHYGDNAVRGRLHQPTVERDLIMRLVNEGRVQFL